MMTVAQAMTLKRTAVRPGAHQPLVVDQQQHEHEDDRQEHAVEHLRVEDDSEQRSAREDHDARTDDDQREIESVEDRRLAKAVVDAAFEAEGFADVVGGRERKNRSRKDRRVEQPEREEQCGEFPGDAARAPPRRRRRR